MTRFTLLWRGEEGKGRGALSRKTLSKLSTRAVRRGGDDEECWPWGIKRERGSRGES